MAAALPLAAASPMMGEVLGAATAASLFPAAAGAAGAGAAGAGLGAGLGATGLGAAPGMFTAANGMMLPTGITPTIGGALGAGDLGMAGTLAKNSMMGGISDLLSPFRMVDPQTLQPRFSALTNGMRGMNAARSGLQMMQPQQQAQRPSPRVAPVQMGSPPQMAANMPTPAQLAAWRRMKGMQQQGRAMA